MPKTHHHFIYTVWCRGGTYIFLSVMQGEDGQCYYCVHVHTIVTFTLYAYNQITNIVYNHNITIVRQTELNSV